MEVGEGFDGFEACGLNQRGHGRLLAVSNFQEQVAAGNKCRVGCGDEAAVNLKAVIAGEEGEGWLVVSDFYGERGAVCGGDVGWVGDDEVELLASYGGEEIALKEADAVGDVIELRVLAGEVERVARKIDGRDGCAGKLVGERNGYAARSGADVKNT